MSLSRKQSFKLAYDSAENMHTPWTFNNENETAGKQDYHQFVCRHPQLCLRNAEFTTEWQKLPSEVSDIPQPTGVNTDEDEENDIHALSTGRGHDTAEVLKKISPDRRSVGQLQENEAMLKVICITKSPFRNVLANKPAKSKNRRTNSQPKKERM